MDKLTKLATLLPILIGIAVGTVLFIFGYSEDAPGMCLVGLSVAFVLIMWGVYNAGMIKKGFLAPILLFCFGAGGIILSIVLLLDGEFENSPWLALVGVALGIALISTGAMRLRQVNTKNKYVTKRL